MFCPKCGAEVANGAGFCSKCGASLNGSGNSQSVTPDNQEKTNKSGKKEKKKGSKKTGIIIAVIVVVLILIVAMSGGDGDSDDSSIDANALIEEVQNGYLGNYDAVAVKDVLEYEYGTDGDWTGGTPENDDSDWYFLVQYEVEDEITIQFQIYEENDQEFHVTYLAIGDPEYVYETAYDMKGFLDMCYGDYVFAYPDCGVVIDESTDNNTVVGHFASTKTTSENSEDTEAYEATNETETAEEASESETETVSEAASEPETVSEAASEPETETVSEVAGMTDEEIMADLEWKGYEFDSIDQMRSRLYESEMATYSEEEVAAMTNEEAYWAFCEMMEDYVEENTDETYTIIHSAEEFNDWYRYAEVGDTIEVEGLVTSGGESGDSIQCMVNASSSTIVYFYVNINDGQRYLYGDVLTITATLTDETSLLNSYPYFDEVSIILN